MVSTTVVARKVVEIIRDKTVNVPESSKTIYASYGFRNKCSA